MKIRKLITNTSNRFGRFRYKMSARPSEPQEWPGAYVTMSCIAKPDQFCLYLSVCCLEDKTAMSVTKWRTKDMAMRGPPLYNGYELSYGRLGKTGGAGRGSGSGEWKKTVLQQSRRPLVSLSVVRCERSERATSVCLDIFRMFLIWRLLLST
ncbi:hypothetical protein J6590_012417 [Homalodisca vitripennis]|nr:hypothetical protein J6590_012417 [Homalodisca vitripennis]